MTEGGPGTQPPVLARYQEGGEEQSPPGSGVRIANFSTKFAYDAINVYGDTAVVRTHHHVGAAVVENGKKGTDYNREVFVLRKIDGAWKIVLYTFDTDPKQGEG